eukprot:TRINITY_DN2322_c0_g1_i23.p1 TRINITY_DN2322_c0_g1~~TRINITY_DN2322_c0_g1_i23.p1  ORF type:complete len:102 (+),score=0.71 TRINITY_DN2322_c0_g1_i23:70-375(+)
MCIRDRFRALAYFFLASLNTFQSNSLYTILSSVFILLNSFPQTSLTVICSLLKNRGMKFFSMHSMYTLLAFNSSFLSFPLSSFFSASSSLSSICFAGLNDY